MKDQLRDPNTLELFPEVVDDLERSLDVDSSKKTKRPKIQIRFRICLHNGSRGSVRTRYRYARRFNET